MPKRVCYNQENNEDQTIFPCTDASGNLTVAACCYPGHSCASNGLCVAPPADKPITPYFRGGCTVENWNDPGCPRQCLSSMSPDTPTPSVGCARKEMNRGVVGERRLERIGC